MYVSIPTVASAEFHEVRKNQTPVPVTVVDDLVDDCESVFEMICMLVTQYGTEGNASYRTDMLVQVNACMDSLVALQNVLIEANHTP